MSWSMFDRLRVLSPGYGISNKEQWLGVKGLRRDFEKEWVSEVGCSERNERAEMVALMECPLSTDLWLAGLCFRTLVVSLLGQRSRLGWSADFSSPMEAS